jgi:uncharacterized protein (TIGR01777 family)
MRVIITGGTGLIGRALTHSLINEDYEVIVLTRNPQKANLLDGAIAEQWDGCSAAGWSHWVDGAGAIVNLAGAGVADSRWTVSRKALIHDSRLDAGRAVVQAVKNAKRKPEVVIQSSAVGYYSPRDNSVITEDAAPGVDFLAKVCVDWEASTASVEKMGVRRAILRIGVVLSANGGALPKMALPFKFFIGGPIGSGEQWLSWIHMADEVAAIKFLIEKKQAAGRFNLVAPNPLTNADFGRAIGKVMSRPAVMPTPAFALKLAFGELSTTLLTGQRVVPQQLQELGFTFQFLEAEEALEDLLK